MESQISNGFRSKHIVVTQESLDKKSKLFQTKDI